VAGVRRASRLAEEQAGGHLLGRRAGVVQGGCRRLLPRGEALADAGLVGSTLRRRPYQRSHDRRRKLSTWSRRPSWGSEYACYSASSSMYIS